MSTLALAACSAEGEQPSPTESPTQPEPSATSEAEPSPSPSPTEEAEPVADFETTEHEGYGAPWALEFLPETEYLVITERTGELHLRDQTTGEATEIEGAPDVVDAGQGGLHDFMAAPSFTDDGAVYVSWVTSGDGGMYGVVARGTLDVESASLEDLEVIWEQDPSDGDGHFSLRLATDGEHLFVTSGEHQLGEPAQDTSTNLGKILRLQLDGSPADDNPFAEDGDPADTFWSIGHRNPLGIEFDSDGNLWASEMGPEGGDELNLIQPGENYGWPVASMGVHYDGSDITDHAEGDGFVAPMAYWDPAISPANLEIYEGDLFTGWQGSALLGGLSGQTLVRVELGDDAATPAADWDMGERIREVEEAPDGTIWLLEDNGNLLELTPAG